MNLLLDLPVASDGNYNALAAMGLESEDIDNRMLLTAALFQRAAKTGDPKAFREVRELLGDEPMDTPTEKPFELPARLIAPAFASVHLDVLEGAHTEYVLSGGRGSAKSSFVSLEIINLIKHNPDMNALVLRKVGNTLRGSVYAQILWAIEQLDLIDEFEATVSPMEITYKPTGQQILFRGADDPLKVKSVKPRHGYIGIVWFEELDQFFGDEECRSIQQSAIRGGDDAYIFKTFNPPKTKNNWANQYVEMPKDTRLVHRSDYRSVPPSWLGKTFLERSIIC